MKVQDILTDESKWCQFRYKSDDGRVCLVGAMDSAYPNRAEWNDVYSKIQIHTTYDGVSAWNDVRGRTFNQVRALIVELDI